MSAGTGVKHSEANHSADEPVHFLQIWIEPKFKGIRPSYEEKHFDAESKKGQLRLIVSPDGRDGSVQINQDATIYASILNGSEKVQHPLAAGRIAYVHVIRGRVTVNGQQLQGGDALKLVAEDLVTLGEAEAAEVLLFDLPK
jgi:redox-sensitive bicupin YhaK (pirin superfamily)